MCALQGERSASGEAAAALSAATAVLSKAIDEDVVGPGASVPHIADIVHEATAYLPPEYQVQQLLAHTRKELQRRGGGNGRSNGRGPP